MKILLPIDGSEGSLEAVHHSLRLVHSGLRSSFVLANVQEPASLYEVVVAHDAKVIEDVSAAAAAHALEAAQVLMHAAGCVFEVEAATGDPGHMIVDIAERFECDLIVMGARGAGAAGADLGGTSLGSVANSVLHSAATAVMIIKQTDV
jgi:nucleotide-binding universal stress UspA family protein